MTTLFPGALDDFTNPLGTDGLAAFGHAALHSNVNDAIEAIEAVIGTADGIDPASIHARLAELEAGGGVSPDHDHLGGDGGQIAYSSLSGLPTLGTAAALNFGTAASQLVQLDGSARLPAVDGSQLTNLPAGVTNGNAHDHLGGDGGQIAYSSLSGLPTLGTAAALNFGTAASQLVQLDGSARLPAVDGSQLTNLPAGVTNGNAHDHLGGDGGQIAYSSLSGLPTLGTAAALNFGTAASQLVQLDGSARLPAVDGSQLTNLPAGVTNGNAHDHLGGDGGQIAYSSLSGLPTLGTAAALNFGTAASQLVQLDGSARLPAVDGSQLTNLPAGVTNGDSHDHLGGDGGQIAYTSLSGLPTLGGAAALNVGTITGTVAAGDDARLSDARAPTAHVHATSDVTGFASAALAAAPAETVSTVGSLIAGATDKATPVDADTVALSDSESAGVLKKWSWANIKTSVTTALTGVFAKLSGVSGGQTLIGGTGLTDKLTLQGTAGNGTSTAEAVILAVGNNGAIPALVARNDGNVAIKGGGVTASFSLDIGGYGPLTNFGAGTKQSVLAIKGNTPGTAHVQMYNADAGVNSDIRFTQLNDDRTTYLSYVTPSSGATGTFFGVSKNTGHFIVTNTISGLSRTFGLGTFNSGDLVFGVNNKESIRLSGSTYQMTVKAQDTSTNAVFDLLTLSKNTTGTAANGLGVRILLSAQTSTTVDTVQGALESAWVSATDASRKARVKLSAYDTAARECVRAEASGSAAMLGFYGVAAVVRPTALTTQLTTVTHTAPGTPDYAIQALISGGYGFATQDEGHTLLSVVANLQTRVSELETKLRSLGLLT